MDAGNTLAKSFTNIFVRWSHSTRTSNLFNRLKQTRILIYLRDCPDVNIRFLSVERVRKGVESIRVIFCYRAFSAN